MSFKFRIHDPRIGRFISVDPLSSDFAWNTPYAFSENRVIDSWELEGLEKISIHTASFAPFEMFGGPFHGDGDDRKFGANPNSSSRVYGRFDVDINASRGIAELRERPARGSVSTNLLTGGSTNSDAYITVKEKHKPIISVVGGGDQTILTKYTFHLYGNNDLVPASPDIDVQGEVVIVTKDYDLGGNGTLVTISGRVFGDDFPSNETYITDANGTGVILGVSGADGNPFTSLGGDNERDMSRFSIGLRFSQQGLIEAVIDRHGNEFTPQEWNDSFQELDPKSGNTNTNTKDN